MKDLVEARSSGYDNLNVAVNAEQKVGGAYDQLNSITDEEYTGIDQVAKAGGGSSGGQYSSVASHYSAVPDDTVLQQATQAPAQKVTRQSSSWNRINFVSIDTLFP